MEVEPGFVGCSSSLCLNILGNSFSLDARPSLWVVKLANAESVIPCAHRRENPGQVILYSIKGQRFLYASLDSKFLILAVLAGAALDKSAWVLGQRRVAVYCGGSFGLS